MKVDLRFVKVEVGGMFLVGQLSGDSLEILARDLADGGKQSFSFTARVLGDKVFMNSNLS